MDVMELQFLVVPVKLNYYLVSEKISLLNKFLKVNTKISFIGTGLNSQMKQLILCNIKIIRI